VIVRGPIAKMIATPGSPVRYVLPVGSEKLPINDRIGGTFRLRFESEIRCLHCGRVTRKSFHQGYCYPCFRVLARCDSCMVRPERCHFAAGTCREPAWGEAHCLVPHTVYLANSSGVKVGITRGLDPTMRWIDQGAAAGLAIRRAADRLDAGRVEVQLAAFVADRTNWRVMLKGPPEPVDLRAERERLFALLTAAPRAGGLPGREIPDAAPLAIEYPVLAYPKKIVAPNLVRSPLLEGTLLGVKGQYLIFDTGVVNVRKYGGHCFAVE